MTYSALVGKPTKQKALRQGHSPKSDSVPAVHPFCCLLLATQLSHGESKPWSWWSAASSRFCRHKQCLELMLHPPAAAELKLMVTSSEEQKVARNTHCSELGPGCFESQEGKSRRAEEVLAQEVRISPWSTEGPCSHPVPSHGQAGDHAQDLRQEA